MSTYRYATLCLGAILLAGCATGSAISVGASHAATAPATVRIYSDPPASFEVVGLVKAESGLGWTDQQSVTYAVEELRKQAATLGANGVLLTAQGTRSIGNYVAHDNKGKVTSVNPMLNETVEGKAIIVH
ncbi:MAG: hypothetical protein ABI227_01675 [Rhodanobacter sp.]